MCALPIFTVEFFFFKQKTAYEMRISDWSSDVCSSDLKRSRHLDAREIDPVAHVVDAVAHPLVRLDLLDLSQILADVLGGGGIVRPERDPGRAIAGDRSGILDAVCRLELRIRLEHADAAAAIFAVSCEKVRKRWQFLERSAEHKSDLKYLI